MAGSFYPAEPEVLRADVERLLADNEREGAAPKALIVPHAGYIYSGPTAACAYNLLRSASGRIRRVVLLGPAHRTLVQGLALPGAAITAFQTPLGEVAVDREACARLACLPGVVLSDRAHAAEHSLEVQLPFLQVVLGSAFTLVPLVVGDADTDTVLAVLEAAWDGPETLILISTDLSHYHPYEEARELDARTCAAIVAREAGLDGYEACGCRPLNGLLRLAERRKARIDAVDYRNSGDTAGPRTQVVGYGAFAVYDTR